MAGPFIDTDLIVLIATVGSVLINGPRRLQRRGPIPAEYDVQGVPLGELTEKQRAFFEPYDQKLSALNYFPSCTYRIANLERSLIRRYSHPTDPAYCTVVAMEVKYHLQNEVRWAPVCLVTFRTDFTDGSSLITRNMKRKTLLDTLPGFTIQDCPNVDEPAALKKGHDAMASGMGCPQRLPSDPKSIFEQIRAEHRGFSEYQVERRLYARHPKGYVLTSKAHWRGIRNHYNPFLQRVPPVRMLLSALIAIGLPSLTYVYFKSAFAAAAPTDVMGIAAQAQIALLLSYVVAGIAMGLLIERNAFLWGFLLTYLGVHLCTGWWGSLVPFSTIAALTAFWVTRLQHRKRLMLAPARG